MEWQKIIGFYNIVRLGSFTKASEAIFRTQPALSLQIKSLENELGCQLFERIGKRRIKLTLAGEILFQYCVKTLDQQKQLIDELNKIKGSALGHLRMAAPFFSLYYLLLPLLETFKQQFPEIEITILDRPVHNIIKLIRDGDIDFGISMKSIVPKDLAIFPWEKIEGLLIMPKGHPLSKLRNINLRDIINYPLILPPKGYIGRMRLEEKFEKEGINYRIVMESSNIDLTINYVKKGFGIGFAIVSRNIPVLNQKAIEIIPINHLIQEDRIAIIMRKDKVLASYEKAFLDIILTFGK
ncbi:MAG TPA: LysR family transcriptional regulator [Syntrophales bacterium]|nr:LysR family transcriptional regulator [Syntrophales bacterium]